MPRGKGEGSIFKRPDGRWEAQLDLGYSTGKRKRQSFYGRTRKEAVAKLDDARGKLRDGFAIPNARYTIRELVEDWLAETSDTRGPGTNAVYLTNARVHVIPYVGHIPLREFSVQDVERLQRELAKKKLSGRSIMKARNVLSGALARAVRHRLITYNPVALAITPQVNEVETRVLSKPEVLRFVDAIHGHRLEGLYLVLIGLAVRRGEVLGLRWVDLDWSSGQLRVRQNLQRVQERGGRQMLKPKSSAGRRELYVPPILLKKLREHYERQELERLDAGQKWIEHGLMFPSMIGTPMEPRNLQRNFKQLREKLGVPELELRGLRHSANSLYLALGVPPHVVQRLMGHSDPKITLSVYAHMHDEDRQDAADVMEKFLGTAG